MTTEPIGCDLDTPWAFAGTDLRNDAFQRLKQEQGVISVMLLEGYSERRRALGKLAHGLALLDRRMRSVFVVFADDQKWKSMKCREVEDLVSDAFVEDARSEERRVGKA